MPPNVRVGLLVKQGNDGDSVGMQTVERATLVSGVSSLSYE